MMVEIQPNFAERIQKAYYMWFTTVRDDGMPQPTPVWFIWENGTFLIYTTAGSHKLNNLKDNSLVALSYSESADAEDFLVIMGEAKVERDVPPPSQNPAYMRKYRQGIADIKMTPESFDRSFSVPIRILPMRVRGE
jgi:PPOX class probable F420-dependent enzyme